MLIGFPHVVEVAATNLQTFLLYLFLPKIKWFWMASIWGVIILVALFGAFFIQKKWVRRVTLYMNVLINAMAHPVAFLTLYASGLFYHFAWYRDMYIITRNVKMAVLVYVAYLVAVFFVYLAFLAIEYRIVKKMNIVRNWDGFLVYILPAHRGYLFAALIVLFGTGRVVENIFYHYLIYRILGLIYFIVIIYLNTRALSKTKALLKTIWLVLFEFVVIGLLMLGALFQAGRPGYIEAYLKAKGIELKK